MNAKLANSKKAEWYCTWDWRSWTFGFWWYDAYVSNAQRTDIGFAFGPFEVVRLGKERPLPPSSPTEGSVLGDQS